MSTWQFTCVDTMKDSRDTCFPIANQMNATDIAQGVALCAALNTTHITCDVFYDYPAYMALWVAAIRATGLSVWFRPHWNAWEGNNGVSATMTPAQYLSSTQAFILANPSLFAAGDIFDACSEADNAPYWVTTYGAGYTNGAPTAATTAFNQYLMDLDTQLQTTLQSIGIIGVNTKIRTLNSFWAKNISSLYPTTVAALGGYVCMDSYPEGSSTNPATCAAARLTELQTVAAARPDAKIIIGELGYSNAVTVTDQQQQDVLAAEFAAIATVPQIAGMNYWCAQGTDSSGGFTHLFGGVRGAWTLRPAALTLAAFYRQQLTGSSAASVTIAGQAISVLPVDGSSVGLFVDAGSLRFANAIGQRSTNDLTVIDEAGTQHYEQGMPITVTDASSGQTLFGGVVTSSDERQPAQPALLEHTLQCADWHYLADKRRAPASYASQTAGFIASDLVAQFLASEGVTVQRGVNVLSAQQSNVESSSMAGFSPGSSVTISQDTTNQASGVGCLKVVTAGGANTFEQIEVHTPTTPFSPAQQITISAKIKASAGTPTVRWFVQSDSGAIGGTANVVLSTAYQRVTRTVTLPNPLTNVWIGMRFDTGAVAQAITFYVDELQIEIGAAATAWETGGLQQSVQAGPTITEFVSNYAKVSECMDALAQAANFYWQIDVNKVLWFAAPGSITGPAVTAAIIDRTSGPKVQHASPLYRNRQFILGGMAQTSSQVETRIGDGTATAFTLSYALATVPTVEVKIGAGAFVAKTVGIGGIDSGKDWYWNGGKNIVFQDTGGTKLTSADTLRVTYVGEFPTIIQSDNVGEQLTTQARETAGTGIVEDVVTNSNLSTIAAGFQLAAGYLSRYAQLGEAVTFTTDQAGFAQGQLVDVYLPAHAINHQQMLIESVTVSHDGLTFWYTVKALVGPINTTWVQFFASLVTKATGTVDKINLGTGSTLTLLQTFTATKAPTATFTPTVNACMFPSATAYPDTTIYPC